MSARLAWDITPAGDVTRVTVRGSVDEDADFATLSRDLLPHKRLRFDLSNVNRINSCGVRDWVNFIRAIPPDKALELEKCSPAIVSQMNMISNFTGAARVLSVQAPYTCDDCGHEERLELQVAPGTRPALAATKCPKCSATMEFDDIEDNYFAFLE